MRVVRWVALAMSLTGLAAGQSARNDEVKIQMNNVMYHFSSAIGVHIAALEGRLRPTREGGIPVFDDAQSFVIAMEYAEITMSTESLSAVLNQHVFSAPDAPIKNLVLTSKGDRLQVKGKKGGIPFEMEGTLAATPDGQIQLHAGKIKAAKVPVKGLLDLLGVQMADLIHMKKIRGVRVEGDDLFLDPTEILPPPKIEGKVSAVWLRGNDIVQIFGTKPKTTAPKLPGNYMAYRGASLRFGKLTMADTDMVLIDMDAKDPFDFYLDHYKDQLVAGYTKTTPAFGLRVYMRDYSKLARKR